MKNERLARFLADDRAMPLLKAIDKMTEQQKNTNKLLEDIRDGKKGGKGANAVAYDPKTDPALRKIDTRFAGKSEDDIKKIYEKDARNYRKRKGKGGDAALRKDEEALYHINEQKRKASNAVGENPEGGASANPAKDYEPNLTNIQNAIVDASGTSKDAIESGISTLDASMRENTAVISDAINQSGMSLLNMINPLNIVKALGTWNQINEILSYVKVKNGAQEKDASDLAFTRAERIKPGLAKDDFEQRKKDLLKSDEGMKRRQELIEQELSNPASRGGLFFGGSELNEYGKENVEYGMNRWAEEQVLMQMRKENGIESTNTESAPVVPQAETPQQPNAAEPAPATKSESAPVNASGAAGNMTAEPPVLRIELMVKFNNAAFEDLVSETVAKSSKFGDRVAEIVQQKWPQISNGND